MNILLAEPILPVKMANPQILAAWCGEFRLRGTGEVSKGRRFGSILDRS